MSDEYVKSSFVEILKEIEGERYREAIGIFAMVFSHPTAKVPDALIDDVSNLFMFVLGKLPILERAVCVKSIVKAHNLPKPLIDRLLREHVAVSSHVGLSAPFTDNQLVEMIDRGDVARQLQIARRVGLQEPVTDKLLGTGESSVLIELARNLTAKLTRRSFDLLTGIALADPTMDKALAQREDLPEELAAKLSKRLHTDTELRLSKIIKSDLEPKRAPFVLRGPN